MKCKMNRNAFESPHAQMIIRSTKKYFYESKKKQWLKNNSPTFFQIIRSTHMVKQNTVLNRLYL